MQKLEKVLVMLIITGFAMRILKINEGALIQFVSTAVLAIWYVLGGAYYIMKGAPVKSTDCFENDLRRRTGDVLRGIAAGIIFGYTLLAVLFKTMCWQNGQLLVETALMLLAILLTVAIVYYRRIRKTFNRQLLIRCAAYMIVSAIAWLLPSSMFILHTPVNR